jgi:hypothetical protein
LVADGVRRLQDHVDLDVVLGDERVRAVEGLQDDVELARPKAP